MRRFHLLGVCLAVLVAPSGHAQGIRDRTRPEAAPATVSESQAADLTLTLAPVAVTAVQTWVRAAATLDEAGTGLTACLRGADASLIAAGQRARAFPPDSKSSVYQARIGAVEPGTDCTRVTATLARPAFERAPRYLLEIVVDRGDYLAVPNEAIIEEGDRHVVYMQHGPGQYMAHDIVTGVRGELYTEVVEGLSEGTLVVTFGSFFIDAEQKLKSGSAAALNHAHQHN